MNDLETRTGLPDALRFLLAQYPRDMWRSHGNFDGLTRFWLERHLMFRSVLERVRDQTRAFMDGEREARMYGGETARLTGALLSQLHGHHQIEDMQYFPTLARLDERLKPGFDLLDQDHHALDAHLQALADDTNAVLQAIRDGAEQMTPAGRLEARLNRFATFLDRHLVDEEELVVPAILHHAPRF